MFLKLVRKGTSEFKKVFLKLLMRNRLRRQVVTILNAIWLMKKELIIK